MATTLTRWDPFAELANLRQMVDRMFEGFGRMPSWRSGDELEAVSLPVDVVETKDSYIIKAAVPGVDPKDVEIQIEDDVLTIRGEFQHREEHEDEQVIRRELQYGAFHRALRLPPTVDAEHAQATFENGMLKLVLPKKPEARARTIKITPQNVIEGQRNGSQS